MVNPKNMIKEHRLPWYGWLLALALLGLTIWGTNKLFAATSIDLQTAGNFAVLGGSGIVDSNPSVIVGDAGSSPTTSNGLTAGEVTGTNYTAGSAAVDLAKDHLTSAYLLAEAESASVIPTELGGTTVYAGAYETASGEFGITGTVTLDAQGDANAVFIFQSGSTLITASNSEVKLINGAQGCNVFWQVTSSATLGTGSTFRGNILALVSITDNGGSTIYGRLLARNGAVTLNNTHVTKRDCAVPTPIPAPAENGTVRLGGHRRDISSLLAPTTTPPVITPGFPGTGGPIVK